MTETTESLRRKIEGAGELESVVRTMKALAASSIAQYERAVLSLDDYYRTVGLGLLACLRQQGPTVHPAGRTIRSRMATGAVVFGSDQGLVGQFNEVLAEFVIDALGNIPGDKRMLAVGERVQGHLEAGSAAVRRSFAVPGSIAAITQLVGRILTEIEAMRGELAEVYLFHNRPKAGAVYEPVMQRLLPLDEAWRNDVAKLAWPTGNLPEVIGDATLEALMREYLFISIFRACAESLASENASRLVAMRRAEKNIDELLQDLGRDFHRLRQNGIDEELFDVIAGYELLAPGAGRSY